MKSQSPAPIGHPGVRLPGGALPTASMLFDAEQEKVPPEAVETLRIWASHVFLEVFSPEAYAGPDRERELALYCWERVLGKEEGS